MAAPSSTSFRSRRAGAVADAYLGPAPGGEGLFVAYKDGEIWYRFYLGSWQLVMNVACQPVAVQPTTWGQIKAQGRGQ